MPSQLEPAIEERFGDLLDQLRATRVEPSAELREHVRSLEPAPRRRLFRRRVLVLAFAAALAVAAVAAGVALRGGQEQSSPLYATPNVLRGGDLQEDSGATELAPAPAGRLQDFRAQLVVRVDAPGDLPDATRRAMRVAESLGGYVVSAQYGGGDTDSVMVLRVPVASAQEAIDRLTGLGEIAGQNYSLQDLQATVDQLDAQADRLQTRVAELEQELRNAKTPRERANIRSRLDQAQRELENVFAQRDGTVAQGQSAEITLTLTAERNSGAAGSDGVISRAVDALTSVWTWVLAVLIVGVPFAALLAAAFLAGRRWRRRSNERLLGA